MTETQERLRQRLSAIHAEALRVHDSPVRADQLSAQIQEIHAGLPDAEVGDEQRIRITGSLEDALRVLRRDDDGREAARHLQAALGQLDGGGPRRPSPFLDD
ncbi:MAG: hypothetical protein GEU90_05560 [Gemmatimonas sp.]|nr:hypothetical protein [Gemmatimonas sp.]